MRNKKTDTSSKSVKIENNNHIVQQEKDNAINKKPDETLSIKKVMPVSTSIIPEKQPDIPNALAENTVLIMKSGATDLRRGPKQLENVIQNRMGYDPSNGNMYGFANKPKKTLKIIQEKKDGTTLITRHLKEPAEWPEYQPPDKPGHTLTLSGQEKEDQLKKLGCPQEL
jgi:hypothetical protein